MDLFSMISSIGVDCLSILGNAMSNRMVTPFPNKTATAWEMDLEILKIISK
jgi:hypothetical protein